MNDGHAHERIDEDLELVDLDPVAEDRASAERAAHEAAQCTFDGLLTFIGASPQSAPLVLDLLDRAQDWRKAAEIAEHIREILQPETAAGSEQEAEHPAEREEARPAAEAPGPVDPIRETAMAADAAALQAHRAAGRQVMAQAYEQHRVAALAAVETMIAHAQLALAVLRWDAENVPVVAGHLIQADRQLRVASHAVEARLQLSGVNGDGLGEGPIPAFSIFG